MLAKEKMVQRKKAGLLELQMEQIMCGRLCKPDQMDFSVTGEKLLVEFTKNWTKWAENSNDNDAPGVQNMDYTWIIHLFQQLVTVK